MKLLLVSLLVPLLSITSTVNAQSDAQTQRDETLKFWTPERQAQANGVTPLFRGNTVFVAFRLQNDLFKLKERGGGDTSASGAESAANSTVRRRRQLQQQHEPPEATDGAVFTNPRTITFRVSIEDALAKGLENLSLAFVNEHGVVTLDPVEDNEIKDNEAWEYVGGFTNGLWTWYLQGTDPTTGDVVTSGPTKTFTIQGSSSGNSAGQRLLESVIALPIAEESWGAPFSKADGGQVQEATGRLYFEDADGQWMCSGTAVKDYKTGRSLILTAAHCMYWNQWAWNVLFIPNRDAGGVGSRSTNCAADPCGCWTVSGGALLEPWKTTTWPQRIPYDYGFYIVDDEGSHTGTQCNPNSKALDASVDAMSFEVGAPVVGETIYGLGYPGNYDPDLRFCAEEKALTIDGNFGESWWLNSCAMLGGSSGGPWVREMNAKEGTGQVVAVNSWGWADEAGMGAAIVDPQSASCLINYARNVDFKEMSARGDGQRGDFIPMGSCQAQEGDISVAYSPSTPRPTPSPTPAPSTAPPAPDAPSPEDETTDDAFAKGDPHFKTFGGELYDFHGECDLVLLHNPDFQEGMGMDIHIRTKIEAFWSAVESAVIKIGRSTLEIRADPESDEWLWFNKREVTSDLQDGEWEQKMMRARMPNGRGKSVLVRYKQSGPNTREAHIYLGPKEVMTLKTFKYFVKVDIEWKKSKNYFNSVGLLGSHAHEGKRLGRDGKFVEDVNAFGQEWQVIPEVDGSLFHSYEGAVVGKKCVMPPPFNASASSASALRGRRLGASSLSTEDAEKACNHLTDLEEKKACVFDVIATQDLNMASTW